MPKTADGGWLLDDSQTDIYGARPRPAALEKYRGLLPDPVREAYEARTKVEGGVPGVDAESIRIGEGEDAEVWRISDGWGEHWFATPKAGGGGARWLATKMADVMAYNVAAEFKARMGKAEVAKLGMGNAAWDARVLELVGGKPA